MTASLRKCGFVERMRWELIFDEGSPPTTGKTGFVSPKINQASTGSTTLTAFDLRHPGQTEDLESGLFYKSPISF